MDAEDQDGSKAASRWDLGRDSEPKESTCSTSSA